MNKKSLFFPLIAVCLAVLLPLLGCGGDKYNDTLDKVISEGVLRIGTDATYPPFETKDIHTGKLVGFDIDLISSICDEIGVKPKFIVTPFDGIIPGLLEHKYEVIISAMTITGEREKVVAFSDPYYYASQVIAVRTDRRDIKGVDDLKGAKIGVQLGTTGEIVAKRIPDAEVISFDNIGAAFLDLENSHIDAVINDEPTTKRIIALKGGAKIVGKPLTSERYGIAVCPTDKRLLLRINSVLSMMRISGKLRELQDKWFR